ncbi:YdeI/OmpD-associated family protein [Terrabacter sp. NPDC080008]|uniref:YdeI/OmpD-associated family protein n=1 Tax=Terrabacter sp. NPDC080008 TaxID=3155176 RepID=UPI00344C5CD2
MSDDLPTLTLADRAAWRAWLSEHDGDERGVWLTLAKKGASEPTSLTYDEALEEALCHGWIDGQLRGGDAYSYRQRFTPRTARSGWSKRNVAIAERLIAEGRMAASGLAAVERARADGRWDAAYAGQASIEVPSDLAAALDADPAAREMFESLNGRNRYAVLYRVETAKRADTRSRRIEQLVAMLARGETIHPNGTRAQQEPRDA